MFEKTRLDELEFLKGGQRWGQLIQLPERKKLIEEIQQLRQTLMDITMDHDQLKYVVCENIKAEYMVIFGQKEYQVYQLFCEYLRLRRKRELVQAKVNRQESIDVADIEELLNWEFQNYEEQLQAELEKIIEAI